MIKVLNAKWDNKEHTNFTAVISHNMYGTIPYSVCLESNDDSEVHKELVELYKSGKIEIENEDIFELNKEKENEIRSIRDMHLRDTDCYMLCDYPISLCDKEEIRLYRQNLRDITKQSGFPDNVAWPKIPKCISKNNN
jgi:hypothetical protein